SAFANTQGGLLILGVNDKGEIEGIKEKPDSVQQKISNSNATIHPSPIINVEIHTIGKKKIIVIAVHMADSAVFHTVEGVIHVRIGSTIQKLEGQSILEFLRNRQILLFEESIEATAKTDDLDTAKVAEYLKERNQPDYLSTHSLKDFLASKKLVSFQPDLKIKSVAILFFAKDPQQFYHYVQIKLVRFDGNQPIKVLAYEDAKGNLPQMIEHAMNFVRRFIPKEFVITGTKRTEILALPEEAVREAIINAVAHRDYFNKNETQLSIFDNRLEITNPGGLPEGMTKELLGTLSIQRNPVVYQMLKDYEYMEGIGSGISKILRAMKEKNLKQPEFLISKEFFRIVFEMKAEKIIEKPVLNKRQAKAMGYAKSHKKISSKEYAKINKVSIPTAVKYLKELEKKKMLKKIGKYRGAHYTINE
ncbi:MAG: putative DNA binding domain-containing protein, partial [Candidatus Diapherotrites archaeon]|nr:putative DNA binding domain-containing protein [Candidatus Diapherotrites archaeon]